MKLRKTVPLSTIYSHEELFSADLANNLTALGVGSYEDAETESTVGTRRADIVAKNTDGVLVVENQFGKADWDHWGRLEAYARLKKAAVAVLVAESFEELMMVTCSLRNEDSNIDWYLIQAESNEHHELSFHHAVRPAIDIQTERGDIEYSKFWQPIRREGLFAGKPVPVRDEGWIAKSIRGITVNLELFNHSCSVIVSLQGEKREDRRSKVLALFDGSDYAHELRDSPKFANIVFPVLDKGKKDEEHWDEIRRNLVAVGTAVYDKIRASSA